MGTISTGEIKLLEEFVTFCMSKRVSSRSEFRDNKDSNVHHSFKSKLIDSFGHVLPDQVLWHVLPDQAIDSIFDVVHGCNQRMCNLCKSNPQDLVMSILEIACQSFIKKHEIFSKGANMLPCDEKHPLNVGERLERKQPNPIIPAQGYQSDQTIFVRKESTVMEIGEICRPNAPSVDTPAVRNALVNPGITSSSKPAPVRLIKKRIHSKVHKDKALPPANLFVSDHTHTSKLGESVGLVDKGGSAAVTLVQECALTSKDCVGNKPLLGHEAPESKLQTFGGTEDLCTQLIPVKKRRWISQEQCDQVMQREDNQSTEINIGKLCPPPLDTPAVINVFAKPGDAGSANPGIDTYSFNIHSSKNAFIPRVTF